MNRNENKDKQGIKIERVKSFFISATKEIILHEGVENVSVRKVANLAGYSYTTIYNYFDDLNALLLEVKASMIRDVITYMGSAESEDICGIEGIEKLNRKYAEYYLEHPHVFRFFYSYRLTNGQQAPPEQSNKYAFDWQNTYKGFVINGTIKESDVEIVAKTIIYALHGLLALYFSDNGLTLEALYNELDRVTEYILKGGQ